MDTNLLYALICALFAAGAWIGVYSRRQRRKDIGQTNIVVRETRSENSAS